MDLYDRESQTIKMLGQLRSQQAADYNLHVDMLRRQAASKIYQAKEDEGVASDETKEAEAAAGVVGSVSTYIDASGARKALKEHVEGKVKDAVKSKAKQIIKDTGAKAEDAEDIAKGVTKTANPLVDTAVEDQKIIDKAASASKTAARSERLGMAVFEGVGKGVIKGGSSLMNIGLGGEAVYDDFKGGHFHIDGSNSLEKASNVLQIGSGLADIAGFAFPPAQAIGLVLGAASSVTGAIGAVEEDEDKEDKEVKAAKKRIADIKAQTSKYKKQDPTAEAQRVMSQFKRTADKRVASRAAEVVKKVQG